MPLESNLNRILTVTIVALVSGCASPWKQESIYAENEIFLYRESEKVAGKTVPKNYAHPILLSERATRVIFQSLKYVDDGFFSDPVTEYVFTPLETEELAGATVQAMAKLGPNERLRFLVKHSSWSDVFSSTSGVSGVVFRDTNGTLNLAFDRIHQPINDGDGDSPDEVVFPHDPTEFHDEVPLVASEVFRFHTDGSRPFPRWLEIDLPTVEALIARLEKPTTKPATSETPPGQDIVERLKLLERLKDEGLITHEEYKQTREKILEGV